MRSGNWPGVRTDLRQLEPLTMRQHDQRRSPFLGGRRSGRVRKTLPDAALGVSCSLLDQVGGGPEVVGEVLISGGWSG